MFIHIETNKEEDISRTFKKIYETLLYDDTIYNVADYQKINPTITRIKEYIKTHYYEKLSLDELADEFYIIHPT